MRYLTQVRPTAAYYVPGDIMKLQAAKLSLALPFCIRWKLFSQTHRLFDIVKAGESCALIICLEFCGKQWDVFQLVLCRVSVFP